jgi:hypothetical protein
MPFQHVLIIPFYNKRKTRFRVTAKKNGEKYGLIRTKWQKAEAK